MAAETEEVGELRRELSEKTKMVENWQKYWASTNAVTKE